MRIRICAALLALLIAVPALAQDRLAGRVHEAANAASGGQVAGVSVVDPGNKQSWRLDFRDTASEAQKQAARDAVAAFDPNAKDPVIPRAAFYERIRSAEHEAIWRAAGADATGVIGRGLTRLLAMDRVDLTADALHRWLDRLVTVGAITAERKAEIIGG